MVFIVYKKGNTNQFIIELPAKSKIELVLKELIAGKQQYLIV